MKFESRKDAFFNLFTIGSLSLFIAILVYLTMGDISMSDLLVLLLLLGGIGLLLWIYFDTSYELSKDEFNYKSGPFRGTIAINRISEIIKGKTMWSGIKAATSRKGLIIKYDKYNEIYISPKTSELFIAELLRSNSLIRIKE